MKNKKRWLMLIPIAMLSLALGGCALLDDFGNNIRQQWDGLPLTLQTYDYDAHKIDEVKGR